MMQIHPSHSRTLYEMTMSLCSRFVGLSHVDKTWFMDGAVKASWSEAMSLRLRVQYLLRVVATCRGMQIGFSASSLDLAPGGVWEFPTPMFDVQTMHDFIRTGNIP